MNILPLILLGLFGLALIAWSLYFILRRPPALNSRSFYPGYPKRSVTVRGRTFRAAVADSMTARAQGLSGRRSMARDEAMLFIFPIAARYAFWMKGMQFSIDMVWIRKGKVVDVTRNAPAPKPKAWSVTLPSFRPKAAASMVLEVNAGLAKELGIRIGDKALVESKK